MISHAQDHDTTDNRLRDNADAGSTSTREGLGVHHENRSDEWIYVQQPERLKVIVVGGGIGGLSAAIALRRQGHHVQIYESSGFSKEVGAALHTAPNANGILKRLGVSCKDIGACVAQSLTEWSYTGVKLKKNDLLAPNKHYEHKYRWAHRIRLHDALRKVAIGVDGVGKPAELHVSMAVTDIDTARGIVTFRDGTSIQGDVVIGADGVHSIARTKLPGGDIKPFPSGLSAFRFLIPREIVLSDPRTRKFAQDDGDMHGVFGLDRSVITYPTADNTILNFICIHPESESGGTEGWGSRAGREKLLEVYREFHPDVLALLEKADESSIRVWKLLDMEELPVWSHGRLTVIGDAAHPFLPFLGQGAAIAIEDAVSIGVLLEEGLSKDEVPERLKLYQEVRKVRAELIQHYTRMSGKKRGEKASFDATQYFGYCFGHNEWDHSAQKLREWKWAKSAQHGHQMSTVFGPARDLRYVHQSAAMPKVRPTFTTATVKFSTSRTILDGFLPPGNKLIRFKSRATIAQCTIRQTTFSGVPALGGRGYNQLSFHIHGVEYKDAEDKTACGAFVPVVFENMADTITTGREELGAPTVWSTIDVERDRKTYHIRTGWEGLTWGNFYLDDLRLVKPIEGELATGMFSDTSRDDQGVILHRYVPRLDNHSTHQQSERTTFIPYKKVAKEDTDVGGDVDQTNGDTDTQCASTPHRVWKATSAHFSLNARDREAFPTLHNIISRLQEMPVLNVIEARVVEGSGMPELV